MHTKSIIQIWKQFMYRIFVVWIIVYLIVGMLLLNSRQVLLCFLVLVLAITRGSILL
jgi:hypothetical protein